MNKEENLTRTIGDDEAEYRHLHNEILRIAKWYHPRCMEMSREEIWKVEEKVRILYDRRTILYQRIYNQKTKE